MGFSKVSVPVYSNIELIFIALTIISSSYCYFVDIKVVTEICEHSDIATTKSDEGRKTSSQMIRQIVNKPTV